MRIAGLILLLLCTGAAAQAPRPVENVTVTGTRDRQLLEKFAESLAAPTRVTGKLARWEEGVCPIVVGLKPQYTRFIAARVKTVAAQAGAPVNSHASCRPNIEIVFTTTPQGLIDHIAKSNRGFLGYYDNQEQLKKLAQVTRPIQAWYTTATKDLRGNIEMDSGKTAGQGLVVSLPCPDRIPPVCDMFLSNARAATVTGSRLGDGLRSSLYHVIIAAEPAKLLDQEIGTLADYIALAALAQIPSADVCRPLPSIANLLAKDCAQPAAALTANDLAYLSGLYRMSPDQMLHTQASEIAYQMEQALAGK
jgi:hypothetical protein